MIRVASILVLLIALCGCAQKSERVVVVYTSQDQVYAEPLLEKFTRETGIKVLPLFDSESVKTAALAGRLVAEAANPRADVFWSNEELISRGLVERGVIDANAWARAGFRTRRLIVNTNFVSVSDAPKSLHELTNGKWKGRVAMAYPVYGTTAAHMVSARQNWGDAKWRAWCEKMAANKPFVVDGNSIVVKLVGAGEAWIGLTDSDDLAAGLRNKLPIASVSAGAEFPPIPNSVGIVKGAPNRAEAEVFYKWAQSESALRELVSLNALEGVEAPNEAEFKLASAAMVEETRDILKGIFTRQ